jgi:hypothetical protein
MTPTPQSGATTHAPLGARAYAWALAAIVLLGTALRLLRLDDGLWLDEGISITVMRGAASLHDLLDNIATTDQSERLQPLHEGLLYFWTVAFGDSEPSMRLLSIIPGVAAIFFIADTARRLLGRTAALWAAALAATSSYMVFFSADIRPYSLLFCLTAVFLDAWAADVVAPTARPLTLAAGVLSAALLCLGSIFGFIPLAVIGLCDRRLFTAPRRWFALWLPLGVVCAATLSIAYLPTLLAGNVSSFAGVVPSQGLLRSVMFVIYGITVSQTFGPPLELLHTADKIHVLLQYAPWLVTYAAVMGLLAVRVFVNLRRRPTGLLTALVVMALAATLLGAGIGRIENLDWLPRHAFYLAPFCVLILAALLARDRSNWTVVPVVALVLLNALAIYNMQFRKAYALDDYRGVADYLKSDAVHGLPVVFLLGDMDLLKSYYHVPNVHDGRKVKPEDLDATFQRLVDDAPHIVVVIDREYFWVDWSGKTFPEVYPGGRYTVGKHVHYVFFDLYYLTRK